MSGRKREVRPTSWPKTRAPSVTAAQAKSVLVVEDSPTQAQALATALEGAGYRVKVANSGEDALRHLEGDGLDIVVSDIVMPGKVDGYELCRRIKTGPLQAIPVVLFTSLADPLDIIRGLECGADNFFTKSHGTEHLLQRIKVLLDTKEARAQGRVRLGVKVFFLDKEFTITSDREQIIDLLMSTFEDAVFQNRELRRREEELARSHQALHGLYQLAVGLNQVASEADVLNTALERALELPGVQAGWISLRDGESGFRLAAARNLPPALQVQGAMEGDCLCRRRLLAGDRDSVTNILECERLQNAKGDTRGLRYHATIPLWVGDRIIGVMNLVGSEEGLFSDDDLKILYGVGNEIAVALERAQLHAGLERLVEDRTAALRAEIAERARKEELLRASEERYRVLFERSPIPMWVVDVETLAFLAVNPAAVEHYGYSEAEFLAMTVKDIQPPEDVPALVASFARRTLQQYRWSQWRHRKQDATLIDVEIAAHTLQFHGRMAQMVVANDVTERHKAETALRRSEAHFRAVVENVTDLITIADADGTTRYVSPAIGPVLGYTPAERLGRNVMELVHPDDAPRVTTALTEGIANGSVTTGVLYRCRHQDGSWREFESTGTNLLADPSVGGLLIISRDTTDRVQLETQLRQAQKMEAVGRLAGGVAHDFNNLLTAITGYTDLVREELPVGDSRREDLDEVRRAAERAAGLTRQLLAFSRQQVLQPRALDLNDVVQGIDKMLHRIIGEDVTLDTHLTPNLPTVHADAGQVEQVIVNLAVNSRDAMPEGGRLTIETGVADLDESYTTHHEGVTPGHYVLLAITDTGCGMDAETKAKIFEPFFTTKGPGKGTGLGLATVYGIVKQTGGHVAAYSEVGQGTTFKVYLPAGAAGAKVVASQLPDVRIARGSETILLVEDEDSVRKLAAEVLTRHGYTVLDARNGAEALRVCGAHAGPIQLLVTDVVMPTMGGPEAARQLKGMRPELKVLYVSGYADRAAAQQMATEQDAPYLQKPFTPANLARKVREVLDTQ